MGKLESHIDGIWRVGRLAVRAGLVGRRGRSADGAGERGHKHDRGQSSCGRHGGRARTGAGAARAAARSGDAAVMPSLNKPLEIEFPRLKKCLLTAQKTPSLPLGARNEIFTEN